MGLCRISFVLVLISARCFAADFASFNVEDALSFTYDGKPSRELLPNWKRSGERDHTICTGPISGLALTIDVRRFEDAGAIEWVVHLTNTGKADSAIIERLLPLDIAFDVDPDDTAVLHYGKGSTVGPSNDDFAPREKVLATAGDRLLLPGEPQAK